MVREALDFVTAEAIETVLDRALYPAEPKSEAEAGQEIITAFLPAEQPVKDAPLRQ